MREEQRKAAAESVNFPCVLKILPNCVFNKKDPIIVGVEVVSGIARVGTVLCVPSQGFIDLGRIASLEHNHKAVEKATKGQSVAMKIQPQIALESSRAYGRHFDHKDELVSRVTRRSIDLLKARCLFHRYFLPSMCVSYARAWSACARDCQAWLMADGAGYSLALFSLLNRRYHLRSTSATSWRRRTGSCWRR